jgi:hypothetical protein
MASKLSRERLFALELCQRGFTACTFQRLANFFDETGIQSLDDVQFVEPPQWQGAFQVCLLGRVAVSSGHLRFSIDLLGLT